MTRYDEARALVIREQKPSPSFVQRRLGVGYEEACFYITRMERESVCTALSYGGIRHMLQRPSEQT